LANADNLSALTPTEPTSMSIDAAATGRRSWSKSVLQLVRRLHVYSGLFLAPWILMYAVSALLLNHPTAFPDQEGVTFGQPEVAGTPLSEIRPADEVARGVVDELNRQAGREQFRIVRPEKAQYRGEYASAILRTEGKAYTVFVDIRDGSGFARLRDEPKEKARFPPTVEPQTGFAFRDQLKDGLPDTLTRSGLPPGQVTVTLIPDVVFQVEDTDGRVWRATYNPLHGSLTGTPDRNESPTTRRFLTRLHVTRGYPPSPGVRWIWALSVDLVSLAMLFWVASGLVMWWQLKSVRRAGAIIVLLSVSLAAWLAVGMHGQFTP
jgi:hypothetical protein